MIKMISDGVRERERVINTTRVKERKSDSDFCLNILNLDALKKLNMIYTYW